MIAPLRQVVEGACEVIFPRSCVHCAGAIEDSPLRHLCRFCDQLLKRAAAPHCTTCGYPFHGETEANRICPHCELLEPMFGQGRTAVLLKGPGRSIVHALKYHHGLHVLEDVRAIMATVPGLVDYIGDAVLVPVPLHPRKERERGYNQSQLLADCAAAVAGSGVSVKPLIRREIDTVSQTWFDREARQENLKNAFALASGAVIETGRRYLIVDDVFTTGSTLNACAAILRRAGCDSLDVLTFGHG